jgi:hypothetical protein
MKQLLTVLAVAVLWSVSVSAQESADSGIIRLRVDLDSVMVSLDERTPLALDSYGNPLRGDAWFLFEVTTGIHVVSLSHPRYESIARTVTVVRDEVTTLEINFISDTTAADGIVGPPTAAAVLTRLIVTSDPPRATVSIIGRSEQLETPTELNLPAGEYRLVVVAPGYDTLQHLQVLRPSQRVVAHCVLKEERPQSATPTGLGMSYEMTMPLADEAEADQIRRRFTMWAEIFAIVPLGQGVLARSVMGESRRGDTDALIYAGLVLTVGSYLTGRIASRAKRSRIRSRNATLTVANRDADDYNKTLDGLIRDRNAETLMIWRTTNRDRGRVTVTVE